MTALLLSPTELQEGCAHSAAQERRPAGDEELEARLTSVSRLQAAFKSPVQPAEVGDGPAHSPVSDLLCARQVHC